VENETAIRDYIRFELADLYHTLDASNGKEGLSLILKEVPDLVISDVIMDKLDGMAMCRKIKANVNTAHIPVILLTARIEDEDKAKGLRVGADAYMTKPFSPDMLKKTVANLLENRERQKRKFAKTSEERIEKITLKSADEQLMERIMKVLNEQIANPELNAEMLSRQVGISRMHLHRKLKELANQSARDFIRTVRMKQAARLLSEKKLSISEVAYAVGYSALSHFSSSFRDFQGMTPTEHTESNSKNR
jgi:YesN/AraC family two-component response regulator